MNVKVELIPHAGLVSKHRPQTPEGAFPDFPMAMLSLYEKNCPFCREPLHNAECNCKDYQMAKQRLLKSFKQDNLWLRQASPKLNANRIPINDIIISPVNAPSNALVIFDEGSEAELTDTPKPEKWYISQGIITPRELKFFIRKKGSTQFYLCEIKNLPSNTLELLKNATKIEIGYSSNETVPNPNSRPGTLGNYHISSKDHIVAEYSYNDYLVKLTEL